jgi:ATP-dependent RNA helicase RhlE
MLFTAFEIEAYMLFNELPLEPKLLQAIAEKGYTNATPIQEKAIPPILEQRDLIGLAQTGTGKTAAFAIPILENLAQINAAPGGIQALVVTPTRELAIQIAENFRAYGKKLKLRSLVIFGGVKPHAQIQTLKQKPAILIATPGRLLDLHQQGFINLKQLQVFVLDEADRMLDMGFIHDVKKIVRLLPKQRQTLLFSATMPNEVKDLAQSLLQQPVEVTVTPVSSTAERIEQMAILVADRKEKEQKLVQLLQEDQANSVLVFSRTKHGADKLVRLLGKNKLQAMAIHGNKSQNARQMALSHFKEGKIRILVATDIAARGIDISGLDLVVNTDVPTVAETYVHRIGRTGRAGKEGRSVIFCEPEDNKYFKNIEKLIAKKIRVA